MLAIKLPFKSLGSLRFFKKKSLILTKTAKMTDQKYN